jgi:general stress protein 26
MDDDARSLDDLLEPGSTLMVGTTAPDGALGFRPLTVARADRDRIEILLDTDEAWVRSFSDGDPVYVTMGDNRTNTWLWLRGTATTSPDPARVDELWGPFADAYFDQGRDTPGIAVMDIHPAEGRYWTTASGRLGALMSAVKAKVGRPDDAGAHGDIAT